MSSSELGLHHYHLSTLNSNSTRVPTRLIYTQQTEYSTCLRDEFARATAERRMKDEGRRLEPYIL